MNFKKILSVSIGIIGSLFLASNASASKIDRALKVSVNLVDPYSAIWDINISRFENNKKIDTVVIRENLPISGIQEIMLDAKNPRFEALWNSVKKLSPYYQRLEESYELQMRLEENICRIMSGESVPEEEYVSMDDASKARFYIHSYGSNFEKLEMEVLKDIRPILK